MRVKVKDRLTAIRVGIYHDTVPIVREAFPTCYLGRGQQQMPEGFPMPRARLRQRINMLARDQQNVRRGLRRQVVERHTDIVFVNSVRRYLPVDDLAKNAVLFRHNFVYKPRPASAVDAVLSVMRSMSAPSEPSFLTMLS